MLRDWRYSLTTSLTLIDDLQARCSMAIKPATNHFSIALCSNQFATNRIELQLRLPHHL